MYRYVSTIAGSPGKQGRVDGDGTQAEFSTGISGIVCLQASATKLLVADGGNGLLRQTADMLCLEAPDAEEQSGDLISFDAPANETQTADKSSLEAPERWARCHRHGGARFSSERSGVAVALTTHVAQPTAFQDAEQATTGQWALARWRQGVTGCASRSTQGVLPGGATRQEVDLTTDP
eukprot:gene24253-9853_t